MEKNKLNWNELFKKLNTIINLLSYLVTVEHDTLEKKATVLNSLGLEPKEIARICKTTPKSISVRLAEAKRKGKRKNKKKAK